MAEIEISTCVMRWRSSREVEPGEGEVCQCSSGQNAPGNTDEGECVIRISP